MDADLTTDEQDAIAALEARFSERAHYPITVEKLLSSWQRFVTEVEQGYDDSIDDYTNDLSTRDLLDDVLRAVPQDLSRTLLATIEPLDRRFQQATRADDQHLIETFIRPGEGWWWSRLPVKLAGSLSKTLTPDN